MSQTARKTVEKKAVEGRALSWVPNHGVDVERSGVAVQMLKGVDVNFTSRGAPMTVREQASGIFYLLYFESSSFLILDTPFF